MAAGPTQGKSGVGHSAATGNQPVNPPTSPNDPIFSRPQRATASYSERKRNGQQGPDPHCRPREPRRRCTLWFPPRASARPALPAPLHSSPLQARTPASAFTSARKPVASWALLGLPSAHADKTLHAAGTSRLPLPKHPFTAHNRRLQLAPSCTRFESHTDDVHAMKPREHFSPLRRILPPSSTRSPVDFQDFGIAWCVFYLSGRILNLLC